MNSIKLEKLKSSAMYWAPVWSTLSIVLGLFIPGMYSPNVHWSTSVAASFGYTAPAFAAGYWIIKALDPDLHPLCRAAVGSGLVLVIYFWNHH